VQVLFGMFCAAVEDDGEGTRLVDGGYDVCLLPETAEDEGCDPAAPGVKGTAPGRRAIELGERRLLVGDEREQRRLPSLKEGRRRGR